MTFFFCSSEFESFTVAGTVGYNTDGDRHDPDFSRGAMVPTGDFDTISHFQDTPISSGLYWTRARYFLASSPAISGGSGQAVQIRDSNGIVVVDLFNIDHFNQTNVWTLRARINGTMTAISGNIATTIDNILIFLDLIIDFDNNEIILAANDVLLASAVISFDDIPNATQWLINKDPGFSVTYASEVAIADESLTARNVMTLVVDGNGAVQGQTAGDFTDIDELVLDTVDVVTFDTDAQEATFEQSPITAVTRSLDGIMFTDTSRVDLVTPDTLNIGYRSGGSQFYPGVHSLSTFFTNSNIFVATNAATGEPFDPSDLDTLELAYLT